jgi:hypothetical protein
MIAWPWAERPLRMVWRVERGDRRSHLVGTAHFFPHSFDRPLARLIRPAGVVLTEGPLDEASSEAIAAYGRTGTTDLAGRLDPAAIDRIEKLLRDRAAQDGAAWLIPPRGPVYFEAYTTGVRPWAAFFSIWGAYLGWRYSVDAEGYQIGRRLGKRIGSLETLAEQLAVLDGIPIERIVRQLNDAASWDAYRREYVRLYLAGDLAGLTALTSGFVTRGPAVVGQRDGQMFEAMRPVFDVEDAVAFVGFPHAPGVTQLFRAAGYTVTQVTA